MTNLGPMRKCRSFFIMKITLNLSRDKTEILKDILVTTLQALTYQEATIKDAIEDHLKQEDAAKQLSEDAYKNLLEFLTMIAPQRMVLAEALTVIMKRLPEPEEEPEPVVEPTLILDSTIMPAQKRNPIDNKKEREAWADAVIRDFAEGA